MFWLSDNLEYYIKKDTKMNSFIDGLMKKMTIEEKLGQLNLPGSGDIVTGQASSSDIGKNLASGRRHLIIGFDRRLRN